MKKSKGGLIREDSPLGLFVMMLGGLFYALWMLVTKGPYSSLDE